MQGPSQSWDAGWLYIKSRDYPAGIASPDLQKPPLPLSIAQGLCVALLAEKECGP